ncbi:MAG: Nif3-like dinuclear metal center hexameric protein [Spirochaetota bacterium]|nr:MAG: Nif3-like dinuclear metal center hexameric protein [Spirochaetota bacterium]
MAKREELECWLYEYLNVEDISDYLPNGLQIEGNTEISKAVTAVSINLDIIERAIEEKADALIVHHGMFWDNEDVTIRGYKRNRIKLILENNLNIFAYHLPLDVHPEISHNVLILKALKATISEKQVGDFGVLGLFDKPLGFDELINRINRALHTEAHFFHYGTDKVKTLYVVSGAGRNEIDKIQTCYADAFLTGDAKESTEYLAKEKKQNYIFAGHYNTERLGMIELGKRIAEQFKISVKFLDLINPL